MVSEERAIVGDAQASQEERVHGDDRGREVVHAFWPMASLMRGLRLWGGEQEEGKGGATMGAQGSLWLDEVRSFGRSLARLPGRWEELGRRLGADLRRLGGEGRRVFARLRALDVTGSLKGGVALMREGVGTAIDGATLLGGVVVESLDYRKQIEVLRVGDRYVIGLGGDVGASVISGGLRGQVDVVRLAEGYRVSVDGDWMLGLQTPFGVGVGIQARAGAEASYQPGIRLSMGFATEQETQEAVRTLLQLSMAQAALGVGGVVLAEALRPPEDELRTLLASRRSLSLRGVLEANVVAQVGLSAFKDALAGLFAQGELQTTHAVRLEWPSQGPVRLVVGVELAGEVGAGGKLGVSREAGEEGEARRGLLGFLGLRAGIEVRESVCAEWGYRLEEAFVWESFWRHPVEHVRSLLKHAQAEEVGEVRLGFQLENAVVPEPAGLVVRLVLRGKVSEILRVVPKVLWGDIQGGLTALSEDVTREADITSYRHVGVSLGPRLKLAGIGVEVDAGARREEIGAPLWSGQGAVVDQELRRAIDEAVRAAFGKQEALPSQADVEKEESSVEGD